MSYSIGFAQKEINPEKGISLAGYGRTDLQTGAVNDGVFDSLFVKILIIENNTKKSAIISYDSLGLDHTIVNEIKEKIREQENNLEAADILIASTHTHSAPATMDFIPKDWVRDDKYNKYLISQTLFAFNEANIKKHAAKISYRITSCLWNKYRRTERPVSADHDVIVIKIETEKTTIILFSYACHPVILRTSKVSSDYVGFARRKIEEIKITGKETFSIFLNGCAGNINPCIPENKQDLSGYDYSFVEKMGNSLGDSVNEIINHTISLQDKPISNKLIKLRDLSKIIDSKPTSHPVEIQLLEFAGIRLITIPGEPFVETGFWIKENFGKNTIPIGYANENIGYIPTPEYFTDPKDASYEVSGAGETVYGIKIPQDLEPEIRKAMESLLS